MGLPQPILQIEKMIESARRNSSQELKCDVGYYSSQNAKINTNQLRNRYQKGDLLMVVIQTIAEWFSGEYVFQLLEHEREEVELLHDIIQDLNQDLDVLKNKHQQLLDDMNNKRSIGVWNYSTVSGAYIYWKPILCEEPMQSNIKVNNQQIIFNVNGIYSINMTYISNCGCMNGNYLYLRDLLGNALIQQQHYTAGYAYAPMKISYVAAFSKDEGVAIQLPCNCGARNGTQLVVEKLT